jgi:squalene-hopene/tetraprenyl-beta-curcumene cyclase
LSIRSCILALSFSISVFAADTLAPGTWSGKAAASYLDQRLAWWMDWPTAARDHGTFCVSCHTAAPYAMARPALRATLAEKVPSAEERKLVDNVLKRVRMWNDVEPFYPDATRGVPKTAESRGTESILNALVLTGYDRGETLGVDARLALDHMWALQLKTGGAKGAWSWLEFYNSPWEGESQYYGAAMAAIAGSRDSSHRADMQLLREYLVRERESQILINRMILLWASTKVPDLLTPEQQQSIIDEARGKQQPDGGFSLSSFVGSWKRKDNTPLESKSDGYATGVVMFVLQQAGVKPDEPQMKRGLAWLIANQEKDGRWLAYSLNKSRDLSSDAGRFMSDAATAYAILALTSGK